MVFGFVLALDADLIGDFPFEFGSFAKFGQLLWRRLKTIEGHFDGLGVSIEVER